MHIYGLKCLITVARNTFWCKLVINGLKIEFFLTCCLLQGIYRVSGVKTKVEALSQVSDLNKTNNWTSFDRSRYL